MSPMDVLLHNYPVCLMLLLVLNGGTNYALGYGKEGSGVEIKVGVDLGNKTEYLYTFGVLRPKQKNTPASKTLP